MPERTADFALGVANHLPHARIQPGDTLLDLGCGGGTDNHPRRPVEEPQEQLQSRIAAVLRARLA